MQLNKFGSPLESFQPIVYTYTWITTFINNMTHVITYYE